MECDTLRSVAVGRRVPKITLMELLDAKKLVNRTVAMRGVL